MSGGPVRLADIPDGGARGLDADPRSGAFRVFIVRRGDRVYAYRNTCPHRRLPLDGLPGRFLTPDGAFIMCANHVALFRIEDGACVGGPCGGGALEPVPATVAGGLVRISP